MIRILIVDDHAVVRQGLRFLLGQQADMQIAGESANGAQAIAQATELLPDVVLLDLLMPKMGGLATVRELKRLVPSTQVIILTSYHEDDQIFSAIKAGALSYLLKDAEPQELVGAVRAAARGESMLHPMVASRLLHEMQSREHTPLGDLTARELDILKCIARGRSNSQIAGDLVISEPTVKTHVSNILAKLHLADRTQAAIYALQQQLVPLKDALERE
ncbi:MAG: response regulator transcription factor [Ktedonobacteraceae bacterium]|nr:response regulator transcription factor [Ktedonobacteraceae bacterium]